MATCLAALKQVVEIVFASSNKQRRLCQISGVVALQNVIWHQPNYSKTPIDTRTLSSLKINYFITFSVTRNQPWWRVWRLLTITIPKLPQDTQLQRANNRVKSGERSERG